LPVELNPNAHQSSSLLADSTYNLNRGAELALGAGHYARSLVWLRRDLRLHDHHALAQALRQSDFVQVVFIFDRDILDPLEDKQDLRLEFIWESLREIQAKLESLGGCLWVAHAQATSVILNMVEAMQAEAVFTNEDYEPLAKLRDSKLESELEAKGVDFHKFKDQVVFEKGEVLTATGTSFSVFTPYKNAWLKRLNANAFQEHLVNLSGKLFQPKIECAKAFKLPALETLGFLPGKLSQLKICSGSSGGHKLLEDFAARIGQYDATRNFPAIKGPSYLSVHLRFGTISIRQALRLALRVRDTHRDDSLGASTWLSELIWRDFYFQILHHHPRVVAQAFKPAYDRIQWSQDETLFSAFCEARTGYPLVDAAMSQLNQTGYMHNRLRMVVASFLTKDLGLDYRRGEAYFAKKLIDFDLAANNGGWQWAASSGCDAQPYFRIFNPITQSEKFDPQGKFIKRYLPQLQKLNAKSIHAPWTCSPLELIEAGINLGENYPWPIVDHAEARLSTLNRYAVVKDVINRPTALKAPKKQAPS
jgi:deoxyribodipyrimidine photo-lyase